MTCYEIDESKRTTEIWKHHYAHELIDSLIDAKVLTPVPTPESVDVLGTADEKLYRLGDKDAYWRPVQKLLDNGTLVEVTDGDK